MPPTISEPSTLDLIVGDTKYNLPNLGEGRSYDRAFSAVLKNPNIDQAVSGYFSGVLWLSTHNKAPQFTFRRRGNKVEAMSLLEGVPYLVTPLPQSAQVPLCNYLDRLIDGVSDVELPEATAIAWVADPIKGNHLLHITRIQLDNGTDYIFQVFPVQVVPSREAKVLMHSDYTS